MIRVKLEGRLGNILFQYAVGRRLALEHRSALKLNLSWYCARSSLSKIQGVRQLRYFDIAAKFYLPPLCCAKQMVAGRRVALDSPPIYRERHFGFDPQVLEQPDGIFLDGFFQSERYFKPIESTLRRDLAFKPVVENSPLARWEREIRSCNSIAVSVRRGDYIGHPLHQVCTPAYYDAAVEYLGDHLAAPRFFVFSDDSAWCRRNMEIPGAHFVDLGKGVSGDIADLRLMSACRHYLLANSTFAWWGAWLNPSPDKIVVIPHRWFNDEALNERAMEDLVLPEWVRIGTR